MNNKKYIVAVQQPFYPSIMEIDNYSIAKIIYDNVKSNVVDDRFNKVYICEIMEEKEVK